MQGKRRLKTDWTVFGISGGFLLIFIILSFINSDMVGNWITVSFNKSAEFFGAYWQLLLLGNFIIGIWLAISKYGNVRLGKQEKPQYSYYRWVAMILTTLLASGGVFWAAAEPMYHYMSTPPIEGGGEFNNLPSAFGHAFMHWGFVAWAILGTLSTIVMMYVHYGKGYPLQPRAILYPIFGKKIYDKSFVGSTADIMSIIAVAAGTLGPLGFLGLQVGYGLHHLFGIPNSLTLSIFLVVGLVAISATSAGSGIDKGIQLLSRINVGMTIFLAIVLLIIGPTMFILDMFVAGQAHYLQNFFAMSLYRGDSSWLGAWTIFFWGWFIGYGPMMAIFISRISRGRTIRELIIAVSVAAPLVSNFWFSVVGGTGVFLERKNAGSISTVLNESGMEGAVMAIMEQMPFGFLLALGFIGVAIVFVATTADTISYTVAVTLTGSDQPQRWLRIFWALIFGALTVALLVIGAGSITAIQNFIVVTAVPVSILLLPPLWLAPQVAKKMAIEQQLVPKEEERTVIKPTIVNK